VLQVGN